MKLDEYGNYLPWEQPKYGTDAEGCVVSPPDGYVLLKPKIKLKHGDIPYDVYAGWMIPGSPFNKRCSFPDLRYCRSAISDGRWTTWARPKVKP